jgi:hypothetical protein
MSKNFYTQTLRKTATPRNSLRNGTSSGGGAVTVISSASGGTSTPSASGDGHSHSNKALLDSLSEQDLYLLISSLVETTAEDGTVSVDTVLSKIKAGYADEAGTLSDMNGLVDSLRDLFLSKTKDDTAAGFIRFLQGLAVGSGEHGITPEGAVKASDVIFDGTVRSKEYADGISGYGTAISSDGMTADSLTLRKMLTVPELRYNRVTVESGDEWNAPGSGVIAEVLPGKQEDEGGNIIDAGDMVGIITLRLESGEVGTFAEGDICMGVFHDFGTGEMNATEDVDDMGDRTFKGFYTVYFRVTKILDESDNSRFEYALRGTDDGWAKAYHPAESMTIVSYGSFTDETRQASVYRTRRYTRYLRGVNSWKYGEKNVAAQFGYLDGLTIGGKALSGYSVFINNLYFTGSMEFLDAEYFNLELSTSGYTDMAYGETLTVYLTARLGFKNVNSRVTAWKVVREGDNSNDDVAWNMTNERVKAFSSSGLDADGNKSFDIEWADLSNSTTVFTFTATLDDNTKIETNLNI